MCLTIKDRKPIEKNIVCFKVLCRSDTRYTSPYGTSFRWFKGITEIAEPREKSTVSPSTQSIGEGFFHAYTTLEKAKKEASYLNARRCWRNDDIEKYVVCKMVIPPIAGEVFYGRKYDIAAKRMRFVKEIQTKKKKTC